MCFVNADQIPQTTHYWSLSWFTTTTWNPWHHCRIASSVMGHFLCCWEADHACQACLWWSHIPRRTEKRVLLPSSWDQPISPVIILHRSKVSWTDKKAGPQTGSCSSISDHSCQPFIPRRSATVTRRCRYHTVEFTIQIPVSRECQLWAICCSMGIKQVPASIEWTL